MNAIRWFCSLNLLILGNAGLLQGFPKTKQSYKQTVDLPAIREPGDSDSLHTSESCHEPFFSCLEGPCIPPNWTCDGENDCGAGEDENEELCSAKNEESEEGTEALRPPRSPERNNSEGSGGSTLLLNSSQHQLLYGPQDSENISEESAIHKNVSEDQFFKSNQEFAKGLIRETAKALYQDQLLNAEPQIQNSKESKLKDAPQKKSSSKKLSKSVDDSFEVQNEDLSSESKEEAEPGCCGTKRLGTQYLEHDESQTKAEFDVKNLAKIDALTNITKDLLLISETLKTFEHSHNKDCIDKEYLKAKKQNLISKLTCPHHFQFIIGSCIYVQVYPPVTWQEASSLCESHGGKLLTFLSISYYEKLLLQMEHDKQRSYSFWIGATNSGGLWTWVDQSPFNSLSLWGFTLRKNSKNLKLSANHPNQCAFLDGNIQSYVNGASCFDEKGFICKSITHHYH